MLAKSGICPSLAGSSGKLVAENDITVLAGKVAARIHHPLQLF